MWQKNPHCERCGIVTVLAASLPNKTVHQDGHFTLDEYPDNMATIQHRYSKTHPLRNQPGNGERRRFLWCHKCNRDYNELYENPASKQLKNKK